jgi:uncharacterized protein YggT (Ycf19 family)
MGIIPGGGPLHIAIALFFDFLILSLFVQIILSWIVSFNAMSPGNPIYRFFNGVIAPIYEPLNKRLPSMRIGMLDVTSTLVFLVLWWALQIASALITSSLPLAW